MFRLGFVRPKQFIRRAGFFHVEPARSLSRYIRILLAISIPVVRDMRSVVREAIAIKPDVGWTQGIAGGMASDYSHYPRHAGRVRRPLEGESGKVRIRIRAKDTVRTRGSCWRLRVGRNGFTQLGFRGAAYVIAGHVVSSHFDVRCLRPCEPG